MLETLSISENFLNGWSLKKPEFRENSGISVEVHFLGILAVIRENLDCLDHPAKSKKQSIFEREVYLTMFRNEGGDM
jgi:hypothetical protein